MPRVARGDVCAAKEEGATWQFLGRIPQWVKNIFLNPFHIRLTRPRSRAVLADLTQRIAPLPSVRSSCKKTPQQPSPFFPFLWHHTCFLLFYSLISFLFIDRVPVPPSGGMGPHPTLSNPISTLFSHWHVYNDKFIDTWLLSAHEMEINISNFSLFSLKGVCGSQHIIKGDTQDCETCHESRN